MLEIFFNQISIKTTDFFINLLCIKNCVYILDIGKSCLTKSHNSLLLLFQAELYRVKKEFHKAEPLYLEATNILEESFGPEDIRYSFCS